MKRLMCLAVALVAAATFGASEVNAQSSCNGGGFGYQQYGYNFNSSGFERPPYFALYPPVYYSNEIVRRPMGVSPFAAPPGVVPVEMTHSTLGQPIQIVNPHFNKKKALPVARKEGKLETDT